VEEEKRHKTTTFHISDHLHTELKMMALLTKKSMGEFIRIAICEKISQLKKGSHNVR
jgi:predicted HicB family RNase H-like nuclease